MCKFFVFLAVWFGWIVHAKGQTMLFPKQVEIATTRSGNHVRTVFEDSRGFIWAGSMESLVRYDGFSIKKYHYTRDGKKGVELIITSIAEDGKGNIWCTSLTYGILVLPLYGNGFGALQSPGFNNPLPKAQKILFDNHGNLWGITIKNEVFSIRMSDSAIAIYPVKDIGLIFSTQQGVKNTTWFAGSGGVFYINNDFAGIITKPEFIFSKPVNEVKEDTSGIYFCSENEIYKAVKLPSNKFECRVLAGIVAEKGNEITALNLHEQLPFLIVSTRNNRVFYVDKHSGKMEEKKLAGINLPVLELYGFHITPSKNLYICTNKGFLSVIPGNNSFSNYTYEGKHKFRCVKFINIDTILFGTNGGGLLWYARNKQGQWENFRQTVLHDGSYSVNTVNRFYTDKKGFLWAGTNGGTLKYSNGKWELIVAELNTWAFTEDKEGNLWLGSNLHGLNKMDVRGNITEYLPVKEIENETDNNYNRVWKVQYYNNKVYLGTAGGLIEFDPVLKRFKKLFEEKLQFIPVWDFLITDSLWIIPTQGQGLWTYSPATKKLSEIEVLNSHVYSMVADNNNNYWFVNDKGVLHWEINKRKINHYTGADGLSTEYFSFTGVSAYNNQVVFCGENGFTVIETDKADKTPAGKPRLWVSSLKYGGDEVGDYLPANSKIVMSYTGSKLAFDIAASLIPSGKFKLHYKLEGVDADWQVNEGNSVAYSNIKPGNYTLMANVGNDWQGATADNYRLFITIQPPFWQTWWFKSIVSIVIIGLLFYIFYTWISRQKLKQARLKSTIEALRSQINPHFVFNSLNSIQAYIYQQDKLSASEYLSKFARLIRMILENSRQEYILVEQEQNFLNLYLELETKRFDGALTYDIKIINPEQTLKSRIPSMLMQPLVENSIKHGFGPTQKKLHINVTFNSDNSLMYCELTDDGKGLNQEQENESSLGLKLIRERLETLSKIYGKPHRLILENRVDTRGAYVKLCIPKYDTNTID